MIKKTFKELRNIDSVVGGMYQDNKELQFTKFGYAYKRFCEKFYIPAIKEFNEKIGEIRLDCAMEDSKTKEVLVDAENFRGYKYTKEGMKSVIQKEKELSIEFDSTEFEVEPYISSFVPENLKEEEKEVLTGILI